MACLQWHSSRPGAALPSWEPPPGASSPNDVLLAKDLEPTLAVGFFCPREAALAGLGIALLPDFSAQAAVRAGKLQVVLPAWRPVGTFGERLYAIRPYSPVVPRAVQAFVAHWRTALAGGFPIELAPAAKSGRGASAGR